MDNLTLSLQVYQLTIRLNNKIILFYYIMSEEQNDQEILMSPLLCKRLDNMDTKLDKIHKDYTNINTKFNKILSMLEENSKRWEDNRKEYLRLLHQNNTLSENNTKILNENRGIYMGELSKIQTHNTKWMENIYRTDMNARLNNRCWRTTSQPNEIKQSNTTIGDILWPWKNNNTK